MKDVENPCERANPMSEMRCVRESGHYGDCADALGRYWSKHSNVVARSEVEKLRTELERAQAEVIRLRAIEQRAEELHHSVTGGGSAFSPTKPRERGIHEAACYILGREA